MSQVPFIMSFDSPTYYNHDIFPNRIYRQHHARHHDPLDFPSLGMIARLGAPGHHLDNRKPGAVTYLNNNSKQDFEVHLDVGLFKPNEITVKVVNDSVVIEGKHEEREDEHGSISRHFLRRYAIPKNSNLNDIVSTMTSDGVLTVRIPKPVEDDKANERIIEIKHVGPSDLFLHNRSHNSHDEKNKTEAIKKHTEA